MVFPATDPFDNTDQQTLRHVSMECLRRVDKARKHFLGTCDARAHLCAKTEEERRLSFAAQLMGGMILATGRMLPGNDPAQFIESLSTAGNAAGGTAGNRFAGLFRKAGKGPDPQLRDRMLPVLATWPDFDPEAYTQGHPQSPEFMAEFAIDYACLREMAFEARKPWLLLNDLESHISMLLPIVEAYERAAFAGVTAERLEHFLDSAAERKPATEDLPEPAV